MNAVNRIELAIRRAASQMPAEIKPLFLLVADELEQVTHDADAYNETLLQAYRKNP